MSETQVLRTLPPRGVLKLPIAVPTPFATVAAKRPGTTVHRSEPLAEVPPSVPAALAPIDGVVRDLGQAVLTSGREVPAVSLEPLSESDDLHAPPASAERSADGGRLAALLTEAATATLSRYVDQLRLAGVWADRWTSPDLLGQLYACLKRPVDTVICSALDFDAALPLQETVAREHALEVVAAVATLAAVTRAKQALVVVDAGTGDACARAIKRWTPQTVVRTVSLPNSYPQSNPTLLLYTLARRKLRPGHLPPDAGALVLDAVAAAAAGRCLLYGEPLLRTPLGIADMRVPGKVRTHLLSVPVGMRAADVLREAGAAPGAFEIRGGSPLRDVRPGNDCVISPGGEVALYLVAPQPHVIPAPCIRCGWCVSGCPVHIHPAGLLEAAQTQDHAAAEGFGLESCIECGVCSYVCPSHLPLLGGIRSLRLAKTNPDGFNR